MKKRGLMFLFLIAPLLSGCTQVHTHSFGEWIEVEEATCKEQGIEKRVCECGEDYKCEGYVRCSDFQKR